jgi:hypothetical protein
MTVDTITLSILTRHWNEFLSNILIKDSMVRSITAKDQSKGYRKDSTDGSSFCKKLPRRSTSFPWA